MLTISKIISCKLIETVQALLYTPLATCFSNNVPVYTRNTKSPVLFPIYRRANTASNEGEGSGHLYGSPGPHYFRRGRHDVTARQKSLARSGLHNPNIVEPDETIE
jgi:hypothetical protein